MYTAIAFAILLVAIVAASLLKNGVALEADAEAEARIRPVANFELKPAGEDRSGASLPEGESAATESGEAETADAVVPASAEAPREAAAIYASLCHTCHELGVVGAPKKGDKAAWAPRIAAGKESLYLSAINGKGAMPPKGGQGSLTDDEVKSTVDYLIGLAQ
jgi:cytochrome c5